MGFVCVLFGNHIDEWLADVDISQWSFGLGVGAIVNVHESLCGLVWLFWVIVWVLLVALCGMINVAFIARFCISFFLGVPPIYDTVALKILFHLSLFVLNKRFVINKLSLLKKNVEYTVHTN